MISQVCDPSQIVPFLCDSVSSSVKREWQGPGWVAQLVGVSSGYTKVAGFIPDQDTYKNQPGMRQYAEKQISLSPPSLYLSKVKF